MAKILNLMFSSNPDHAAVIYLHMAISKHMKSQGYQVTNLFLSGKKTNEHDSFWEVKRSTVKGKKTKLLSKIFLKNKLIKFIENNHFDCIICDGFSPTFLLTQLQKKHSLPPCIGVIHGIIDVHQKHHLHLKKMLHTGWKIVGVTDVVTQHLIQQNFGATEENTLTIDNAIDFDELQNQEFSTKVSRRKLGLPENSFIFGSIGRLVDIKRHRIIISAVERLRKQNNLTPDMLFVIIGDGPLREILQTQINNAELKEYILLLGEIPNASHYVKAFNINIMPSASEGLSIAMLEMLTSQNPFICSDIESFKHVIPNKICHFSVDSPSSLSKKIVEFHNLSPNLQKELGKSLTSNAKEKFNISRLLHQYEKLIYKITTDHSM
ncbi:glycosyltransferase [Endozoicomonas sp. 2B-B]